MPVEFTIDKEKKLIHRVARGATTFREFMESIKEAINHPDFSPGMKSLSDLREVKISSQAGDIQQIAYFIKNHSREVTGGKAAVVVSSRVSYGMLRMLEIITDKSPLEIKVFYDVDKAKEWLGLEE